MSQRIKVRVRSRMIRSQTNSGTRPGDAETGPSLAVSSAWVGEPAGQNSCRDRTRAWWILIL